MITRREFGAVAAAAAAVGPTALRAATPPALGAVQLSSVEEWLNRLVAERKLAGLVAGIFDGHITYTLCAGHRDLESRKPMRPDTLFRFASITKPITAAAAMMLVDDGVIALDEPVERWLPELRARRVVRRLEDALDNTVPAKRSITLRDLLTMQMGIGAIFADPSSSPLIRRLVELEVAPGPSPFAYGSDEFMSRIAEVPLAYQPGERWLYHTGRRSPECSSNEPAAKALATS